jgi:hypothetical protein
MIKEQYFIFEKSYDIELLNELGSEERFYFPSGEKTASNDGLILKISPFSSKPWIGIFAFGDITKNGLSGVYSMPDKEKFCVVSNGMGYIVASNNATIFEIIDSIPITDVRCVKEKGIILFADYTQIMAYDSGGLRWQSKRLSYDGFKIISLNNDILVGEFWDIRNDANSLFEIDIIDGALLRGGIGDFG